ncbi:MAG: aminoacyl-tRNA hydrolase [Dehalococcoidia bacterium]
MRNLFRQYGRSSDQPEASSAAEPEGRSGLAWLIVGIGNPGKESAGNRHNLGFRCINRLARRAGIDFSQRGRLASTGEGQLAGRQVILAKPRTYVNKSGEAVRELLKRHRLPPEQLLTVYDDLDLPVGVLRIRERGSHGGQNGMRSILAAITSQEFPRVRIGVGRPVINGEATWEPEAVGNYLLSDPPAAERKLLDEAVERAADAIEIILSDGAGAAMARFNRS